VQGIGCDQRARGQMQFLGSGWSAGISLLFSSMAIWFGVARGHERAGERVCGLRGNSQDMGLDLEKSAADDLNMWCFSAC